jgi:hypothetical protein
VRKISDFFLPVIAAFGEATLCGKLIEFERQMIVILPAMNNAASH